jgi:quinol monooxygenase YgiN
VIANLTVAAFLLSATTGSNNTWSGSMKLPVLRLSRGSFPPEKYQTVRDRLATAQSSLLPAIRALRGCLHYWAGIDRASNTMVNISVWASIEDARQMESLAPMLALAQEFTSLGVQFERPITNYESLWEI